MSDFEFKIDSQNEDNDNFFFNETPANNGRVTSNQNRVQFRDEEDDFFDKPPSIDFTREYSCRYRLIL